MNLTEKLAGLNPVARIELLARELETLKSEITRVIEAYKLRKTPDDDAELLDVDRLASRYQVSRALLLNRITRSGGSYVQFGIGRDAKTFVRKSVWVAMLQAMETTNQQAA